MDRLTYKDYEQIQVKGLDIVGIGEKNADILSLAIEKLSYYEDLEEQGMINNNQWISCSERWPKENEPVLGTVEVEDELMVMELIFYKDWLKGKYELIAWQPLPQPYKEADSK